MPTPSHTSGRAPYGFTRSGRSLVIQPKEAEVVQFIYHHYPIYKREKTLAAELNQRGYRTRSGKVFYAKLVGRILDSPAVKGFWKQELCPIIISPKQWEDTQKLRQYYQVNPPSRFSKYIFHNYAYCKECSQLLSEKETVMTHASGERIIRRRYICEAGHDRIQVLEVDLEERFVTGMKQQAAEGGLSVLLEFVEGWLGRNLPEKRWIIEEITERIEVGQGGSVGIHFNGKVRDKS